MFRRRALRGGHGRVERLVERAAIQRAGRPAIPRPRQRLQAAGEVGVADGLRDLLQNRPLYGLRFDGKRYDAGDKLGFLKATVEYALRRDDLGGPFRDYLKSLKL